MAGNLWMDPSQKRLRKLQGQLTGDVEFGGGILGRLDKSGTFEVQQPDLGHGVWLVSYVDAHIAGRAFFFKTIGTQQKEISTNFKRVPDNLSLAIEDYVELIGAENSRGWVRGARS